MQNVIFFLTQVIEIAWLYRQALWYHFVHRCFITVTGKCNPFRHRAWTVCHDTLSFTTQNITAKHYSLYTCTTCALYTYAGIYVFNFYQQLSYIPLLFAYTRQQPFLQCFMVALDGIRTRYTTKNMDRHENLKANRLLIAALQRQILNRK